MNGRVSTSVRNLFRKSWFFPANTNSSSADLWGFCLTIFLSCVSGAMQKGRIAAKLIGLRCDKAYGQKQYCLYGRYRYAQPAKLLVQIAPRKRRKVRYQLINSPINGLRHWRKSGAKGLKRNNWLFETFPQCCHAVANQRPMKFIELILNLWAIVNRIHFVSLDLI